MADAGYSKDNKLVNQLIREQRQLTINPGDHPVCREIKQRINHLIYADVLRNSSYCGRKYVYHSAWEKSDRLMIKINQLRWRHWYFEKIV